jgi:hypothetical protein
VLEVAQLREARAGDCTMLRPQIIALYHHRFAVTSFDNYYNTCTICKVGPDEPQHQPEA